MKKVWIVLAAAGLILLMIVMAGCGTAATTQAPATAAPATQSVDERIAAEIDQAMTGLADRDQFSGSLLAARNGNVLLSKGYGLANIELDVSNTPEMKFRIGSLTKQFTAMGIMQLQQQGRLNVQDPICRYLTDCPSAWQSITIHQLLTHSSGIRNYSDLPTFTDLSKKSLSPLQIQALVRGLTLDFAPGTNYHYSNTGYILLGMIIEKASGLPYCTFLQKNIFVPLQMADSGCDDLRLVIKKHATGYQNSTTNAEYMDMGFGYSAGGVYSTVEDLYKWDQALYSETLLQARLRDQMFKPWVQVPGLPQECGYGWMIGDQSGEPWLFHSGQVPGFEAVINRYPASQDTIILLSNREDTDLAGIVADIAPVLLGGE